MHGWYQMCAYVKKSGNDIYLIVAYNMLMLQAGELFYFSE